jgi:1-piperideine-2-carboxylate/1-pyrroline-2-carboxylate reductase [NAD(P)H]
MKTLDARATAALLPYSALVDALRAAAIGLARGEISCPQRQVMPMAGDGAVLSMLALASDLAVHKLVTYVPTNPSRRLPTIQGEVSVWDAATGAHRLSLDGATVTGRRTAALSMLGISALRTGRPEAFRIFGTGTQALHHVEAIAQLYPQASITVAARTAAGAEKFCAAHAGLSSRLSPARSADDDQADVVICCTSSSEPVYEAPARRGRLLIAVGSFTPAAAEIGAATVRASRIFVDDLDAARAEAGDLIRAGVDWRDVQPLAQRLQDAHAPEGPVFFKTVGHAAWDLAAARVAVAHLPPAPVDDRDGPS